MTAYPDLERRVADLFADEAPKRAPDWLLHDALAAIDITPQRRPRLRVPWRFPIMHSFAKVALAAVAVVAVGVVGLAVLRPGQGPGVEPSASPSPSSQPTAEPSANPSPSAPPSAEPSASPSPTPRAGVVELPPFGVLDPGRYTLGDAFSQPITFDVPDGWSSCGEEQLEIAVCGPGAFAPPGVAFLDVNNVVADPCAEPLLDPPVGPSVDDLVAAISSLEGFTATVATEISIDSFEGKAFEVAAPDTGLCTLAWATPRRTNGVGLGEVNLIRILDIDGERVTITGSFGGSQAGRPVVEAILESIGIGP